MLSDVAGLMACLNELYGARKFGLALFTPYLRSPVFQIQLTPRDASSLAATVQLCQSRVDYERGLPEAAPYLRRELPDYGQVQALMVQSGIVAYPNYKDLMRRLLALGRRDFHKGDRPVFLGLDTNLLRDRFYSANAFALHDLPAHKIGFSVSPYVKDELTFDKRKYSERDLGELASLTVDRRFAEAILACFNQSCLIDRLRRLGFVELARARRLHWIELLPELEAKELEASPDLNIIKTYKLTALERQVDVLLLSRDDSFVGHAQGIPGIEAFQVANPAVRSGRGYPASWRSICQLLYLSGVVFGAVRVETADVSVWLQGVWKGKRTPDWNRERLQVAFEPEDHLVAQNCRRMWRVLAAADWSIEAAV